MRLGLDIGGTKAAVAIGDEREILASEVHESWSHGSWRESLRDLLERADALLRGLGVDPSALEGVGISSPGPLDIPAGRIVACHNIPGWIDVPVVEVVAEHYGCPVALENDANAAALAESHYGVGRGARCMIFLTMSSGVGGGIVVDGKLHAGASFQAGEVGHIPVELDGRACTCGLRGCLEAYTSGHAIAGILRQEIAAGRTTSILEAVSGDTERINAHHWVAAIRSRDPLALELRESFLDRLTQGLAMLIPTLDPDLIVLGTVVQRNPELFLEEIRVRTRKRTWNVYHGARIEPGALGPRLPFYAGLAAAASAVRQASGTR